MSGANLPKAILASPSQEERIDDTCVAALKSDMAKFDLTSKMGQYLDRHLVFPLLEFLSAKGIYNETELLKAKLDILSKTNMIDYAIDIRKQLYPDEEVPEDLKQRRIHIVAQLQELQQEVEPILQIMGDDEVMKNMENMRDSKTLINFLSKDYKFEIEMIDSLHKLAKYRYECGNYSVSTSYLYFCMLVLPPNDKNYLSSLWGKFASEILVQNWDSALEDLNKLREYIDSKPKSIWRKQSTATTAENLAYSLVTICLF
ncbi:hypothetical protein NQ318_013503 [Aromia moschata]|uniref:Eukaryotic translation initiation factor 3 subunit E N-terminal domain-containing protein n=1 Tax=Aromia moschata TaxID=1265417 RepID=A0AAV8YCC7_9CUCU|nr:hypothetical protein NQ318_013503 [Aromia moschata]